MCQPVTIGRKGGYNCAAPRWAKSTVAEMCFADTAEDADIEVFKVENFVDDKRVA